MIIVEKFDEPRYKKGQIIKKQLIERDGCRCAICGEVFESKFLELSHIIPISYGGDTSLENSQLVCSNCHKRFDLDFSEAELHNYIFELLQESDKYLHIAQNVSILGKGNQTHIVDIVVKEENNNSQITHHIDVLPMCSLTLKRAEAIVENLNNAVDDINNKITTLVIPGKLTEQLYKLFRDNNIEIWDREYISKNFSDEISRCFHPIFQKLFMANGNLSLKNILVMRLKSCKHGKQDWVIYQKLVGDIFSFLFSHELSEPIPQKSDYKAVNIRDFIIPNYCETGFWAYIRDRYLADFIVVDAKNYTHNIKKDDVLQIANYLKSYGTGNFGIIVTRNGADYDAVSTLRNEWIDHKKLIIVLNDNDIEQMILNKLSNNNPAITIRQKIEDFRITL